jgi:hypothetical protein
MHVNILNCPFEHNSYKNSFHDAMATVRRVPGVEHHFQIVITRAYEEGDQELLEDEEESASIQL